jgi:hypothetical protein
MLLLGYNLFPRGLCANVAGRVKFVIRRLPNSLSHVEESMAGHMGVKGVY